ncbi:MAG: MFS transporter [Rhodospirillales bacterium]|nr:MFS transporter [Rhodospirillales bacterium]
MPPSARAPRHASRAGRIGAVFVALAALNFFLAAAQTGFGPFIPVYLTKSHWSQADIGFALSVGTAAALLSQLPAGIAVDATERRRTVIAIALIGLGISALLILPPTKPAIGSAEVLHAIASALLGPAIAALTLGLGGQAEFGARLGGNARYAALGSALAAAGMGAMEGHFGEKAVFLLTAALILPALAALVFLRPARLPAHPHHPDPRHPDHAHAALHPAHRRWAAGFRPWDVFRAPGLHVFAACTVLFQLANAALLPLALNRLALQGGDTAVAVPGAIIAASLTTALISPLIGRLAQSLGRRPILMLGLAALPVRAVLFAAFPATPVVIAAEVLDGLSGAVFGVLPALVAADYSRQHGFLNLTIASLGLAASLGAMFSTSLAGLLADRVGLAATFLVLGGVAAASLLLAALAVPETRLVAPHRGRA